MSPVPHRAPRVPKSLAVIFKDAHHSVKACARDISMGGLFISTENPLTQGEKFSLELQLPGHLELMDIKCEVSWVRKQSGDTEASLAGMGVKFLELTKKNKELLNSYTKTLEKLGIKVFKMSEKDNKILQQYLKTTIP